MTWNRWSRANEIGGRWLSISYLVGAQIAFVGFYNAMVLGAERTACFFCEFAALYSCKQTPVLVLGYCWPNQLQQMCTLIWTGNCLWNFTGEGDSTDEPPPGTTAPASDVAEDGGGGRCGKVFDQWGDNGGCVSRFFFALPAHGVRRIYCVVIAVIELGLVLVSTDLLVGERAFPADIPSKLPVYP